jgi:hypothetical protein
VVLLLAALLSVPIPEGRHPHLLLNPQQRRQRTQDVLVAWLLAEAEHQPVLTVWEELHWADPSTLELLGLVIAQAPTACMLTLVTARPEFRPPWASRSHLTQLTLGRLPHPHVETMVRQLTGGKPLPAEVLAQVIAKTDGVPLFVEELVKMILESGLVGEEADRYALTGRLPPLAIPATLQDSLMARLDRLATARAVAQLGAVLGREFAYALIRADRRSDGAAGAGAARGRRTALPAGASAAGAVLVQTCPHPGDRVPVVVEEYPAAVPPAECPGVGGAVSRNRRDAARAGGPPLHRGCASRVGHPVLAAGRTAGPRRGLPPAGQIL